MPPHVHRPSLVAETAKSLRQAIQNGEYVRYLPSERQLSASLNISRPTLRAALVLLEREGYIDKQGRTTRRTLIKNRRRKRIRKPFRVRLLQFRILDSSYYIYLDRNHFLAEQLAHKGIDFQVEPLPEHSLQHPDTTLENLLLSRQADLWLLQLSTEDIQRWFWNRRLPALVLGSVFNKIGFPSIDTNHRATCRHASGMLVARGHTSLALLHPPALREGDRHAVEGFREGIRPSSRARIQAQTVVCPDDPAEAGPILDSLLRSDRRPDGWLTLSPRIYMMVFSYLASRQYHVGRDISLICRAADPYFSVLTPGVAHYQYDSERMNRKLLRMISGLLHGSFPTSRHVLIPAEFKDGPSLRSARQTVD